MWNDAAKGACVGAVVGAGLGLGTCVWLFEDTLFFPGDTMLAGAIVFGVCGYIWGEDFFDWLRDYWPWLL